MIDVVWFPFHYPRFEDGRLTIWDAPVKVDELLPSPECGKLAIEKARPKRKRKGRA